MLLSRKHRNPWIIISVPYISARLVSLGSNPDSDRIRLFRRTCIREKLG